MCVTILIAIVNGSAIGVQWRKIFVISKAVCALHANQLPTALAREKKSPRNGSFDVEFHWQENNFVVFVLRDFCRKI